GIRDRNVTGVQTCALPIYGPAEWVSARQPTGDDPGRSHGRWRRRRFDLVRLERRIRPGPRPGPIRSRGRRERLDLRGPAIPESGLGPDLPRGRTSLAFVRPSDRSEEPRARERDPVGLRGRGDRLLRRTGASDRRRDGGGLRDLPGVGELRRHGEPNNLLARLRLRRERDGADLVEPELHVIERDAGDRPRAV